ncbi:MAG: Hsp70 family protein [Bacillota bacterium]
MNYTLGIDLGTTFSVMAIVDDSGSPVVLKNKEGSALTPSVVYLGNEEPIVGEEAKEYQAFGETEIAAFFKRAMGNPHYHLEYNDKIYDPTLLSSFVLKKLKMDAETALGGVVENAVITVPAYFNNKQREATVKAGQLAGLNVLRIISEPTAAAIAYGMDKTDSGYVLVYDLGGGTFDVTIASMSPSAIDVIATDGDHSLGGKDWDDCLAMYISEQFEEEFGMDPLEDDDAFNSILVICENAKKQLTARDRTVVRVVYGGNVGQYEITKDMFQDMTQHLLERTWSLANEALKCAKLNWNEVGEVILVGGSTRMPMVAEFLEDRLGRKPKSGINVDEVVASGAAIQAAIDVAKLTKSKPMYTLGSAKKVQDVMSHSLGMIAVNEDRTSYINSIIIPKNTVIPSTKQEPYQIQTSSLTENVLEVYITQGESKRPHDCEILGKYVISGITHIEHASAIIDISYSYDDNGIVQVQAGQKQGEENLKVIHETVPEDLSWMNESPVEKEEYVHEPFSVIIAIDLSYSMEGKPLREAQKAAKEFVNKMNLDHTKVGIVGFANRSYVTLPLMDEEKTIISGIDHLTPLFQNGTLGYSNDGEPFSDIHHLLTAESGKKMAIVLTDGLWSNQFEAIRLAKRCHHEDIDVIAIGFGTADKEFLRQIATTDQNALTTDLNQIVSSFSSIAQVLSERSERNGSQNRSLQFFNKR